MDVEGHCCSMQMQVLRQVLFVVVVVVVLGCLVPVPRMDSYTSDLSLCSDLLFKSLQSFCVKNHRFDIFLLHNIVGTGAKP